MGRLGKGSGLQQSQDLRLSVFLKIPVALLNPAQDGVEEWGQKKTVQKSVPLTMACPVETLEVYPRPICQTGRLCLGVFKGLGTSRGLKF